MAEQWLSIVEYARTYAVSDMTVRRRIKNGKLHAVLKDGKYYIPVTGGGIPMETRMSPSVVPSQVPNRALPSVPRPRAEEFRPREQPIAMKNHPAAQTTYLVDSRPLSMTSSRGATYTDQTASDAQIENSQIPDSLARPLRSVDASVVDTRALLAFCEAALRKVGEGERRQSEKFKYKMTSLEEKLHKKDMEINQLRQQIEDLKVLINILEKKSA